MCSVNNPGNMQHRNAHVLTPSMDSEIRAVPLVLAGAGAQRSQLCPVPTSGSSEQQRCIAALCAVQLLPESAQPILCEVALQVAAPAQMVQHNI